MVEEIVWVHSVGKDDVNLVGGKGANLGELIQIGLPVPPAFVVTAHVFRRVLEEQGVLEKIEELLRGLSVDDTKSLLETSEKIQKLVLSLSFPDPLRRSILEAYRRLGEGEEASVAVRSSATAEDLPSASFAGQQASFLNVQGDENVLESIKKCWASLYNARAIFYRVKHGFPHEKVSIAVVIQKMVDAEKAGVLFTRHPTTGDPEIVVEATWGLGEGVVSGSVSPDHYVLTVEGEVRIANIPLKESQFVGGKGQSVLENLPGEKRKARVLSDSELKTLTGLAKVIENHYGMGMDVEWAFDKEGKLHVVQARPITTLRSSKERSNPSLEENPAVRVLVVGLGASPGKASGRVVLVQGLEDLDLCREGDVLVARMTSPDMVPAMKRASAIVTDEGGMTCHAAIVSRELGVPAVVGTKNATHILLPGTWVTVDGEKGVVYEGTLEEKKVAEPTWAPPQKHPPKPMTATKIKVNISMPEAVERALSVDPDGVGLLRIEHIVLGMKKHPLHLLRSGRGEEYVRYLVEAFRKVVDPMFPRPVWIRSLDAPTDEFRSLEGGQEEPLEPNPMLGFRGIRRAIVQTDLFRAEVRAVGKLLEEGYTNVGLMLPLVARPLEIRKAKEIMVEEGVRPHEDVEFGIMVEIPAAALTIDDLLDEGVDFVSLGTNDLTQYTLAVDRNNENVAPLYSEFHPAVEKLVRMVIESCSRRGVESSICGQAGSNPKFVEKLVRWGIGSVSSNVDSLPAVREMVARTELRLLLEKARSPTPS